MMLLDWSGSMSDVLFDTVKQLINLVEFCRRKHSLRVYFFTSERKNYDERYDDNAIDCQHIKVNKFREFRFEDFNLVNCAAHRMNKKTADLALKMLYHMCIF